MRVEDVYMPEIMHETGEMFEIAIGDYHYDIDDFTNKYMTSKEKHFIDERMAYRASMSAQELLDDFLKNDIKIIKNKSVTFNPFLANWIGEFYTKLQSVTGMYSEDIIKVIPISKLRGMADVLHDLDMDLAVRKVINTMNLQSNNVICFHKPEERNGYLSNWYHSKFTVDSITFDSGEQYMMYMKATVFNDKEIAKRIMKTTDFAEIKALGRKVRGFTDGKWDTVKLDIMYKGLLEKFKQNPTLKEQLLTTGNSILAECAVKDKIWGIGLSMHDSRRTDQSKWLGQNLLGKTLMRVRSTLQQEE